MGCYYSREVDKFELIKVYNIKSKIFNNLTKSQKSQLCRYLDLFVKKNFINEDEKLSKEQLVDIFIEEETYYLELDSSRLPWLVGFIEDEAFLKDLKLYINEVIKKLNYKESQKENIEKQKEYQKQQRKKAQEYKMSKDVPTKAQLSYYKSLCKKRGVEIDEEWLSKASKLDLKNRISFLKSMNETKEDPKKSTELPELLNKLNELKSLKNKL